MSDYCTGLTARRCPLCGDCVCPEDGDMSKPTCPLHGPRSTHAESIDEDALHALIERDPFAALCRVLREAGAQLTFHGAPVSESEMRAIAGRHARDRILAAVAPAIEAGPQPEEHW